MNRSWAQKVTVGITFTLSMRMGQLRSKHSVGFFQGTGANLVEFVLTFHKNNLPCRVQNANQCQERHLVCKFGTYISLGPVAPGGTELHSPAPQQVLSN